MVVNRRHVDIENMQEFNNRVRTYWRELARKEIADDRKAGWAVYQRIGGFDLHKDHNVVIVNFYTPEQFAKTGRRSYRNDTMKELFKDVKEEDIQISSISTRHDLLYYRNHAYYEVGKANIIRVNFSKSEKRGYFQMEPEIWGPFIDKQMKAGKTKVVSWGFSSLIIPRGADNQHDAVSVDGFSSLADALSGSNFDDDVEMPENLNELMDAHYKAQVHLYRLVASSDDEDEG
jgi:hypothetical protein